MPCFSSRRWAALTIAAALMPAGAQAQDIPRQSPTACKGQAEIRPLQPLQIVTPRGRTAFQVEVADSHTERQYGLMCRRTLAANRGMLFDFQRPQLLAFWMRNTLIPLDIIYIGADGRVVSVVANARPLDETPLPSNGVARAVLELAGGRAAQLGLLPGDRISHRIFSNPR